MPKERKTHFYGWSFWWGLVIALLLIALIGVIIGVAVGSKEMKTETEEMLQLTRIMKNATLEMQAFIQSALPKREMAELLIMAHSAAVSTLRWPKLTQKFCDWLDENENEPQFAQWSDLSSLFLQRAPTLLDKLEHSLDSVYNASESFFRIEDHFLRKGKIEIEI